MQRKFYDGRKMIINAKYFHKIFSLYHEEKMPEDEDEIRGQNDLIDYKKLARLISLKEREINDELVKKIFLVQDLGRLLKKLRRLKNTKNKSQLSLVRSGLIDLKDDIKKMSQYEKETEKPNEIVNIVEKILEFNNKNQRGQGLQINCLVDYQILQHN